MTCALLVGCAARGPQPSATCLADALACRESQTRVDRLRYTLDAAIASEARRPGQLSATLAHSAWYFENQAVEFRRNLAGAGDYVQRDLSRAGPRLAANATRAAAALRGKPDQIPISFILLFY